MDVSIFADSIQLTILTFTEVKMMGCPYYIFDNYDCEFLPVHFAEFEAAENHINQKLFGDYERYIIFEKLS